MAIEQQLANLNGLADRSRKVLEDPRKQPWHDDARSQLAQIEEEIERLKSRPPPQQLSPSPRGGEGRGEGLPVS